MAKCKVAICIINLKNKCRNMQNGKIFENSIFEISFGDKFGNYSYFFNRGGYITATIFASLEIEYGS